MARTKKLPPIYVVVPADGALTNAPDVYRHKRVALDFALTAQGERVVKYVPVEGEASSSCTASRARR